MNQSGELFLHLQGKKIFPLMCNLTGYNTLDVISPKLCSIAPHAYTLAPSCYICILVLCLSCTISLKKINTHTIYTNSSCQIGKHHISSLYINLPSFAHLVNLSISLC